ncbi:MAG: nucleotidyltransferase family protein [Roseiarcus sp.]
MTEGARAQRPSAALRANTERLIEILSRFDVENPRVFGSVARNEDDETSDLDILVDPGEALTLFDLARLESELSAALGCKVDVVTPGGLGHDVARNVFGEAISLR